MPNFYSFQTTLSICSSINSAFLFATEREIGLQALRQRQTGPFWATLARSWANALSASEQLSDHERCKRSRTLRLPVEDYHRRMLANRAGSFLPPPVREFCSHSRDITTLPRLRLLADVAVHWPMLLFAVNLPRTASQTNGKSRGTLHTYSLE